MAEENGNDAVALAGSEATIAHPTESISLMFGRIKRYDSVRMWRRYNIITDEEYTVVDELRTRLWREVEEKLMNNPEIAGQVSGAAGSFPLHQACERTRAPLSAVRALITAYPDALKLKDNLGRSPLFAGCCNLDAAVFRELLYANPDSCTEKDENELLPHHFAAVNHGADLQNLWLLCKIHPDGAKAVGRRKNTPLHDLCHTATNEKHLEVIANSGMLNDTPIPRGFWDGRAMGEPVSYIVLLWARLQLLLMAAHNGSVPQAIPTTDEIRARGNHIVMVGDLVLRDEGIFSACHAAAGCGAPVIVSRAVMNFYHEGVKQTDHFGRLPIHLAAAKGHIARFYCDTCIEWKSERMYHQMLDEDLFVQKMCRNCFTFAYTFAEENGFQEDKPILFPSLNGQPLHLDDGDRLFCCLDIESTSVLERQSTVDMLLDLHPGGALHRDSNGLLPIHYAAQSGDMDGCILPFQAEPRVFGIFDYWRTLPEDFISAGSRSCA